MSFETDGLESVVRKKKKKQDLYYLMWLYRRFCYQYGSSFMQGKGVDI